MFFGAGCFEPAIIDRMLGRQPPDKPMAMGYGKYEDAIDTLQKALTPGPYILGDRFSAADVYLASQIGFGLMTKALEAKPAFVAYMARVGERPAYKRFNDQVGKYVELMKATA